VVVYIYHVKGEKTMNREIVKAMMEDAARRERERRMVAAIERAVRERRYDGVDNQSADLD
jgi:hypothetical protein